MRTIVVQPNQSMLDVIVQATGSMEAGMQFCYDNNVSISDTPAVGAEYMVTDAALALGDAGNLQYLVKNGITVGTLGEPMPVAPLPVLASAVLTCSVGDPFGAADLIADVTGTALLWYEWPTGGIGLAGPVPTPDTTYAHTEHYYVSQTVAGIESDRVEITVVIV